MIPSNLVKRSLGSIVFALPVSIFLGYAFFWTTSIVSADLRTLVAELVAAAAWLSASCTVLLLATLTLPAGKHADSRAWGWFVLVAYMLSASVMVAHQWRSQDEWMTSPLAGAALIWAPLCCVCLVGFRLCLTHGILDATKATSYAIFAGVLLGYAALQGIGAQWMMAAVTALVWILFVLHILGKRRHSDAKSTGVAKLLTVVFFLHICFGGLPFGFDVATFVVLFVTSWVTARFWSRTLDISMPDLQSDDPTEGIPSDTMLAVDDPKPSHRPILGWGEATGLGLTFALFLTLCWTEPQYADLPTRPSMVATREPDFHGDLSRYSRDWDRHNNQDFENALASGAYNSMSDIVRRRNSSIRTQVLFRRIVKVLVWIVVAVLAAVYFYLFEDSVPTENTDAPAEASHTSSTPD